MNKKMGWPDNDDMDYPDPSIRWAEKKESDPEPKEETLDEILGV